MREPYTLIFGPFRLDPGDERLWCEEEVLRLTHKAFAVLRYLVEHPEQLVTKEALFEAVWPDTYVSDAALAVCIREIRQALRDSARTPQFIETVHGRGYRFIAPVTTAVSSAASSALSAVPLVGREGDLAQLHQWFATALQGERQMGFITGEAGIGKTTLVDAFIDQIGAKDDLWIGHGQCIEHYGAGEAYLRAELQTWT